MPTKFQFSAIKSSGEKFSGEMVAADRRTVIDHVERNGGYVIDIQELSDIVNREAKPNGLSETLKAPSRTTVTAFLQELSLLLTAGFQLQPAFA